MTSVRFLGGTPECHLQVIEVLLALGLSATSERMGMCAKQQAAPEAAEAYARTRKDMHDAPDLGNDLTLLAAGCMNGTQTSGEALYDASRAARADHAAVPAVSLVDRVVVSGARLIALIDAGCAR